MLAPSPPNNFQDQWQHHSCHVLGTVKPCPTGGLLSIFEQSLTSLTCPQYSQKLGRSTYFLQDSVIMCHCSLMPFETLYNRFLLLAFLMFDASAKVWVWACRIQPRISDVPIVKQHEGMICPILAAHGCACHVLLPCVSKIANSSNHFKPLVTRLLVTGVAS